MVRPPPGPVVRVPSTARHGGFAEHALGADAEQQWAWGAGAAHIHGDNAPLGVAVQPCELGAREAVVPKHCAVEPPSVQAAVQRRP